MRCVSQHCQCEWSNCQLSKNGFVGNFTRPDHIGDYGNRHRAGPQEPQILRTVRGKYSSRTRVCAKSLHLRTTFGGGNKERGCSHDNHERTRHRKPRGCAARESTNHKSERNARNVGELNVLQPACIGSLYNYIAATRDEKLPRDARGHSKTANRQEQCQSQGRTWRDTSAGDWSHFLLRMKTIVCRISYVICAVGGGAERRKGQSGKNRVADGARISQLASCQRHC